MTMDNIIVLSQLLCYHNYCIIVLSQLWQYFLVVSDYLVAHPT